MERTCSISSELFLNHFFLTNLIFNTSFFWISHLVYADKRILPTITSQKEDCGPEVRFTQHVWQTKAERTPPESCKVQTRQCKFKSCPSVCLNPPPLILGQFMRWNYPKWTVGGPYTEEDLLFSTVIGA